MSRISLMTWGLLLILFGVQLNLVDTFVLTPRATNFWNTRFSPGQFEADPGGYTASNGNFSNAGSNSYAPTRLNRQATYRTDFPYSTPNYRRNRQSGTPAYQASNGARTANAYRRTGYQSQYATVGNTGPEKTITPPTWCCWPPIFLGAVLFLFGAASGRD